MKPIIKPIKGVGKYNGNFLMILNTDRVFTVEEIRSIETTEPE